MTFDSTCNNNPKKKKEFICMDTYFVSLQLIISSKLVDNWGHFCKSTSIYCWKLSLRSCISNLWGFQSLSIATAIASAAVTPVNGKHSANYRCHQRGWKRLCTSKGKPLKPQTGTGSAKVTSQSLEVKGDPLTAHSFLPPASFVLSSTSNVQICGPWAT